MCDAYRIAWMQSHLCTCKCIILKNIGSWDTSVGVFLWLPSPLYGCHMIAPFPLFLRWGTASITTWCSEAANCPQIVCQTQMLVMLQRQSPQQAQKLQFGNHYMECRLWAKIREDLLGGNGKMLAMWCYFSFGEMQACEASSISDCDSWWWLNCKTFQDTNVRGYNHAYCSNATFNLKASHEMKLRWINLHLLVSDTGPPPKVAWRRGTEAAHGKCSGRLGHRKKGRHQRVLDFNLIRPTCYGQNSPGNIVLKEWNMHFHSSPYPEITLHFR